MNTNNTIPAFMKNIILTALLFVGTLSFAQTPCSSGTAAGYDCDGLTLQSRLSLGQLGASSGNDSWGWTDPNDGKEYAIVGLNNSTFFIDITDPVNPRRLGRLMSHNNSSSSWRDVKVYNNHAYIVSEASNHGLQIFDLTNLRGLSTDANRTFAEDGYDGRFGDAHNIIINEDTGVAYILGSRLDSNPGTDTVIFFDLTVDPENPTLLGDYTAQGYTHDAQVVTYNGPDTEHTGKEIFIGSNEDEVVILDVTNKASITLLGTITYANFGYTHQGWFTEDQRYFLLGDEHDEMDNGFNTKTIVLDLSDLDSPALHFNYYGPTSAIDHNGYIRGNRFYQASYSAGVRILKIDDIANQNMTEVNSFDTYQPSNSNSFHGAWNVYPYFESGNIIVSNYDEGFFIVKDPFYDNVPPTAVCQAYTATLDPDLGTVTVTAADLDNGSSDNMPMNLTTMTIDGQDEMTFTCEDVGSTFNVTFEIEDDYGLKSTCATTITVEAQTTEPIGAGLWTNGTPNIGSHVKISDNYDTAGTGAASITACSCEIDATKTLTVNAGDFIQIERDIVVNGNLIVKHQGSVVQTDPTATVTKNAGATINVELTTPVLSNRDFMVMGSPMDAETRNDVFTDAFLVLKNTPANFYPLAGVPSGGTNFVDDKFTNGKWLETYNGNINVGEGYIVRPQNSYNDPAVTSYDMTYTLGTLNNGDVNMPLTYNGPIDNPTGTPHLMANPYASPINAQALINNNILINEVYFWEHLTPPSASLPGSNAMNFDMDDLSMYNGSMGIPAPNDPGITTTPNGVISTGQGFLIKSQGAGTMTFINDIRLTSGNTTLRNANEEMNIDRLTLEVRNAEYGVGSYTGVAFNPAGTENFDARLDTERLATVVSIFSHLQDGSEQLGIQTMPQFETSMKIPMGFTTQVPAELEYTISIAKLEGERISNVIVNLIDNELGIITDLTNSDYTFKSDKNTYEGRFTLQFEEEVLGPNDNMLNTIAIFPNPTKNIITIASPNTTIKSVKVSDLRGRRIVNIISEEDHEYKLDLSSLETTVYFVEIQTEAGSITKKVIKY